MNQTALLIIFCATLVFSCSKKTNNTSAAIEGVWVEQSLHLDTLDFEKGIAFGKTGEYDNVFFRSKPFFDATINPTYVTNLSTAYGYYIERDSIYLRNYLSSSLSFKGYSFKINNDGRSFSIGNFYNRTQLTSTLLVFEKLP